MMMISEHSPSRKISKNKTRPPVDVITRNFTRSSMSAWCRVDCYERQYHIASFYMDQAVVCVDGTQPVSDKNRISFASLQSHWDDPKVAKIKSCIGKGVQMHLDEKKNLWATRLGKNPIYVRGHTLCPELVKLNGKLTQGVPMKVLDTAAFKEDLKKEVELSGVDEDFKEQVLSRLKVCMSFIKDTVVDEETPCWFEIWLLKVQDSVKRYLDNYQKRRDHEEKRKSVRHIQHLSGGEPPIVQKSVEVSTPRGAAPPPMRRCKSGDQLKSNGHRTRAQSTNVRGVDSSAPKQPFNNGTFSHNGIDPIKERTPLRQAFPEVDLYSQPKPMRDSIRREKSMDIRVEQRLLRREKGNETRSSQKKKSSAQNTPEQSMDRTESMDSRGSVDSATNNEQLHKRTKNSVQENSIHDTSISTSNNTSYDNERTAAANGLETENKRVTPAYIPPKGGMSYRQVFDIQSSDYIFNITPPNYTRHRRYSDSDTESLQNFVSRVIPTQDDSPRVLQNIQPKKWIKNVRRKSEDQPKRKMMLNR